MIFLTFLKFSLKFREQIPCREVASNALSIDTYFSKFNNIKLYILLDKPTLNLDHKIYIMGFISLSPEKYVTTTSKWIQNSH
jgi:hypothetical protein